MRYKKGDRLVIDDSFPDALNAHIGRMLSLTMKNREFVIVDKTIDYPDGTQTVKIQDDGKGIYHTGPISSKRFKKLYDNIIPKEYFEI
jgi:hypothetical protein